jgi:hypothetical protein
MAASAGGLAVAQLSPIGVGGPGAGGGGGGAGGSVTTNGSAACVNVSTAASVGVITRSGSKCGSLKTKTSVKNAANGGKGGNGGNGGRGSASNRF